MMVLENAAHQFGVDYADLIGHGRERKYTTPRFAVAVILYDFCGFTLNDIADALNKKDHTTIMNAVDRGRELALRFPAFRSKLFAIATESGIRPKELAKPEGKLWQRKRQKRELQAEMRKRQREEIRNAKCTLTQN